MSHASQKTPNIWQKILEDVRVVRNDPAMHSRFELLFNYPGFWAVANYRVANWLYRKKLRLLARMISGITQILTNIDIHPGAKIGRRVFIDHGFGVVIGETTIIGDDCLIYQGVTLGGVSLERTKRHPTLEDGVVVGAGAKVLGNITLGRNSKIGANSVVIKPVPEDSTAIGIPARVITKGRSKSPTDHNKLPDIDKQMFQYLIKRVAILEQAVRTNNPNIDREDAELEEVYQAFIQAMKN